MKLQSSKSSGFTLAEILIALGLLGVIAAFTIPKVLQSTGTSRASAVAKEAASMISGAFSTEQLNGTFAAGDDFGDLVDSLNYVQERTSTTIGGLDACSATLRCLVLHNGGVLQYDTADTIASLDSSGIAVINLDPDGAGATDPVSFVLYGNGRLSTFTASGVAASTAPNLTENADPAYIANWT